MEYLKADTAVTVKMGPFLDEDDGKTAETGLTITTTDVRLSKNGGDFAACNQLQGSAGMTHDENGWYDLTLSPTDVDTEGRLVIAIHESGALPVWREFMVVNANVYDSLFAAAATDYLQVDTVQISSDATAADDLELFIEALGTDDKVLISTDTQDLTGQVKVDANIAEVSDDATAASDLELFIEALGTDDKVLISTDAQDLSGTLDVNTKLIEGSDATDQIRDAVVDDSTRIDASALNTLSGHDPGEAIMGTTDLGTGTGFTAIPWNAAWDAEVQSECADALNAYDPPTKTEMDDAFAALNDITVAQIIAGIADGSYDLQEMIRIIFAACACKSTGGGTTNPKFRDSGDSKNRIDATVDSNGNRTAVTLDGS